MRRSTYRWRGTTESMVHSKVVVVDPFSETPIVITGSHNLGPKASTTNDDNMAIIENAPGLACTYAVNIVFFTPKFSQSRPG
jgi:phosphatidylserine/phosphatidylglycerophosphate/cardiolipin synthase-like enzyme